MQTNRTWWMTVLWDHSCEWERKRHKRTHIRVTVLSFVKGAGLPIFSFRSFQCSEIKMHNYSQGHMTLTGGLKTLGCHCNQLAVVVTSHSASNKVAFMHIMFIHDKKNLVRDKHTVPNLLGITSSHEIFLKSTAQDGLYINQKAIKSF